MGSEPAAPAVVVVVVAFSPGPWFEESLSALSAQDYSNFSVLVMDIGGADGLAERVAQVLPAAHIGSAAPGASFAQAANLAMSMVDGAAHVLLCHDDVALAPDALRLLVEEAYRRNGGLTCPKLVAWDAPDRLLSVGIGADRLGVTHPLVERGELDQGQHDAAREVFVAPSAAVLVRLDLWQALGGFEPMIGSPGEDLDLCWRAQLAGARAVVAPHAHARHLETATDARGATDVSREVNRLRTLWTCYSALVLVVVVPLSIVFALVEVLWKLVHHKKASEAVLPLRAFGASLRQPALLLQARRRAQSARRSSDMAVWAQQSRGSARLRGLVRQRLERGHQLAWAASRATLPHGHHEVGGPGDGASQDQAEARPKAPKADWRVTACLAVGVLAVLLIGVRHLLGEPLPLVGQVPSTNGGISGWWGAWWSGTGPAGLGSGGAALPGMFVIGVLGIVCAGSASAALHVLVIGCLVAGPFGAYVEARAFAGQRGRLAATLVYTALPVPYNAFAQGHIDGLIAFAAAPWLIGQLCRLSGHAPYTEAAGRRAWARFMALGLFLGVASSLDPVLLVEVLVIGAALAVGAVLTGSYTSAVRMVVTSALTVVIAFASLLPWSVRLLGSWRDVIGTTAPAGGLSVPQLLRFHTGPYGAGALGWAIVVAGVVCLFIGRSWRLEWAARLWAVALVFFVLTWATARGWFSGPQLEAMLAPAGASLALATALGGASVQADLPANRFGWRQLVPALGALAVVAACLPLFSWAGNGQWDMPTAGAEAAYAFAPASASGDYRVLWAGPAGALPLAVQGRVGSLAFATSADGTPRASQLLASSGPGSAKLVSRDLRWAVDGLTTGLGRLLGPMAVRYVVVPIGALPATAGGDDMADNGVARRLAEALDRQVDLEPAGSSSGYEVFVNTAWVPMFTVSSGVPPQNGRPMALLNGQRPVRPVQPILLTGASQAVGALPTTKQATTKQATTKQATTKQATTKQAAAGTPPGGSPASLYAAVPYGTWSATLDGKRLPQQEALGWASAWRLPPGAGAGKVVLSADGHSAHHVEDIVMLALWAAGLSLAFTGLRSRSRAQLAQASLGLGLPAADVSEIDWSDAMRGEDIA